LEQSFIVAKLTESHDVVKLFSHPVSLCVGSIGPITRLYQQKRRALAMQEQYDFFPQHSGHKDRRRLRLATIAIVRMSGCGRHQGGYHIGQRTKLGGD
jgi:hypothetical protein